MASNLSIEESELHETEMGLVEAEAELHAQEQGLEGMEKSFRNQNRALSNLVSYVSEQEASLRSRAAAMGSGAVDLVEKLLSEGSSIESGDLEGAELDEERSVMIERRAEIIENLESTVGGLEARLLAQEKRVSEALRQLITSASSLSSDDDDGDDDQEGDPGGSRGKGAITQTERTSDVGPGETFTVIAGEAPARTEASMKAEHEGKIKAKRAKKT